MTDVKDYDRSVVKERFAEPTERQLEIECIAWSMVLSNPGERITHSDIARACKVTNARIYFLHTLPKMQFPPVEPIDNRNQSTELADT